MGCPLVIMVLISIEPVTTIVLPPPTSSSRMGFVERFLVFPSAWSVVQVTVTSPSQDIAASWSSESESELARRKMFHVWRLCYIDEGSMFIVLLLLRLSVPHAPSSLTTAHGGLGLVVCHHLSCI